jgi:hypothetical protein
MVVMRVTGEMFNKATSAARVYFADEVRLFHKIKRAVHGCAGDPLGPEIGDQGLDVYVVVPREHRRGNSGTRRRQAQVVLG